MTQKDRRQFLTLVCAGCTAIPLGILINTTANAQDEPQLDESDPQAQALGYVHQSATDGQTCSNCQLYQGEAGSEWGPCAIFPGKSVNANGWCKSWIEQS